MVVVVVVVDGTEVVVDDEDIRALLPADATLALLVAMIHRPRVSESVSVTPHLAETLPPAAMPRRGAGLCPAHSCACTRLLARGVSE